MTIAMTVTAPASARSGLTAALRSHGAPAERPAPSRPSAADAAPARGEQTRAGLPAYGATATPFRTDAETRGTLVDILA
jgi:hypothetical protein